MADTGDQGSVLQRDLWRQARQQIHEYEQKSAELQLDRQQHEKALKAKKEELERVRAATAQAEKETVSTNRKALETNREEMAVQRQVQERMADVRALTDQLQLARQRLEQLKKDRANMNAGFEQHLTEQRAVVATYSAYCQSADADSMQQ